jgi:hypothetical protein
VHKHPDRACREDGRKVSRRDAPENLSTFSKIGLNFLSVMREAGFMAMGDWLFLMRLNWRLQMDVLTNDPKKAAPPGEYRRQLEEMLFADYGPIFDGNSRAKNK